MGAAKKCLGGTKLQLAIFESVKAKVKEKVWTCESAPPGNICIH